VKPGRWFGILLITAAVAGFIFGAVGLFEIWSYQSVVTKSVLDTLALLDQAVNTTQDGLTIVGQILPRSRRPPGPLPRRSMKLVQ
jgi:hypothetical protein